MIRLLLFVCVATAASFAAPARLAAEPSQLWGKDGELWQPSSRLPDFSYAGYRRGEQPLPAVPVTANVVDFGADGTDDADDVVAFRRAIAESNGGAIFIPAGRYVIDDIIEITKPGVVLRGDGPDETILYFPKFLNDVRPDMGATTTGDATSNYSWSGGFIWVKGRERDLLSVAVIAPAARGDRVIQVDHPEQLFPGDTVRIELRDDRAGTLIDYLYAGDPGPTDKLGRDRRRTSFVARVTDVDDKIATLDRPLPWEIRLAWRPVARTFTPSVSNVGIEGLGFEFPNRSYAGHFTELGANAIAISGATDCWVHDIRIHNADSGVFLTSRFCTIDGVVFTSDRRRDEERNSTGHHGIEVGGDDNLVRNFDFQTRFIHDLTVTRCHGNVFCDGRGEDLSLDHHKYAPYANLFTNLDAGAGTQLWVCGGGADLGKHCAAWGTFWNIRAARNLAWPPEGFCPDLVNLVGLTTDQPTVRDAEGRWFEAIVPRELEPKNLWEAQRKARLGL